MRGNPEDEMSDTDDHPGDYPATTLARSNLLAKCVDVRLVVDHVPVNSAWEYEDQP